MLYILAIFIPPLAVLISGRPGAAVLNLFLTLLLWIPGVLHAFIVIGQVKSERHTSAEISKAAKVLASARR